MRNLLAAALSALAIAAVSVVPSFAAQPSPANYLTDVSRQWNPKVMVAAGVPVETFGFIAPTRYVGVTTTKLSGDGGIANTTVVLTLGGTVNRHLNLVADGKTTVVDFGPPSAGMIADGGAYLDITYTTQRVTSIVDEIRVASAPVTN